jgi:hypothetical protein
MAAGGGGPIAAVSAFGQKLVRHCGLGLRGRSSRNQNLCLRGWLSSTPLSVWQVNAT